MVPWELTPPGPNPRLPRPRLAVVSYLNTVPLVWGMQHGHQQTAFDLRFCVPSECARQVESGEADLGIVPVAEIARQGLAAIPGTGIACRGAVRSILLVSRVEPGRIRRLAVDSGSRTSVRLARVILQERYGASPETFEHAPDLGPMLAAADAALLIGDAALAIDPAAIPYPVCLDLGAEWWSLTGLPMVFALWAGRPANLARFDQARLEQAFRASLDFGLAHLDQIVAAQSPALGFAPALVREYLSRYIVFHIGTAEQSGLAEFLRLSAALDRRAAPVLRSESVSQL